MSFPCKEELIGLEAFAKRQVQIYPDACDYGYKLNESDKNEARKLLKEITEFYGCKLTGRKERGQIIWSETKVAMPIEKETIDTYGCIILTVSYNFDSRRKIEFLTITEERAILSDDDGEKYGSKILRNEGDGTMTSPNGER